MGQRVTGHGSNGSPISDWSHQSWVRACDPLTWHPETFVHAFFCFQWPTRWHEMLQLPIRSWRRFAVTWNEWNINNVGAFIIVTSM